MVGDSHRVVNAGVGGYGGVQVFALARVLSDRKGFDILVYVGHHNDFYEPSHTWHDQQRDRHSGAEEPEHGQPFSVGPATRPCSTEW